MKNIHMPKSPLCDDCKEGKLSKGDGVKGPSAPEADLEVGFDIIGHSQSALKAMCTIWLV